MNKKWLLVNLAGLLIAPVLLFPATHVVAQEDNESEQTTEVHQENNAPSIEMDENGRYIDPLVDPIVTEEKVKSPLFVDVYEEYYKKILHDYQLGDLLFVTDQATSYDEFMDSFQIPDIEPSVEESEDGNTLVYYVFEDTTDTGTPIMVELSVHFNDDQLLSVALSNLAIEINPDNVDDQAIPNRVIDQWFSDGTPLALGDIESELKRVTGISESLTANTRINTVVTQTESKEDQPMVDYLLFFDGYLLSSLPESLQVSIDYPGARLFSYTTFMTQEILNSDNQQNADQSDQTEESASEE